MLLTSYELKSGKKWLTMGTTSFPPRWSSFKFHISVSLLSGTQNETVPGHESALSVVKLRRLVKHGESMIADDVSCCVYLNVRLCWFDLIWVIFQQEWAGVRPCGYQDKLWAMKCHENDSLICSNLAAMTVLCKELHFLSWRIRWNSYWPNEKWLTFQHAGYFQLWNGHRFPKEIFNFDSVLSNRTFGFRFRFSKVAGVGSWMICSVAMMMLNKKARTSEGHPRWKNVETWGRAVP